MRVEARGQVYHYFWGEYVGVVGLVFEDEVGARAAHAKLGAPWTIVETHNGVKRAMRAQVSSEGLTQLKAALRERGTIRIVPCDWQHCEDRCQAQEIDGLPHSIDNGPPFTWSTEVEDARQQRLL